MGGIARFAPPRLDVEQRCDGSLVLRSPVPLEAFARCTGKWLEDWAARAPDRSFLAARSDGAWRTVTYREAHEAARAIGATLLARGLTVQRPVAILCDNGIDHALLALGAQHAGIPYAPISAAYSLLSSDHGKLQRIFALLRPGLAYVDDAERYAAALGAVDDAGHQVVASRNATGAAIAFDDLLASAPGPEIGAAFARLGPDTVAKFLFTSGSTGEPKGVINTHRMLCSNQQAIRQVWPFLGEEPPVIVDWLPWSHTFGSNHNFNMVLANGGTLYIDAGKPVPGLFERSVANLREIAPNLYFNVPRGYQALLDALESDKALAEHFFSRLRLAFYAGAALPQHLWERLERLAQAYGADISMVSAWGATETAPAITAVHWPIHRAGVIGLPLPGCEVLMTPVEGKLEARVRGANVTPGYWRRPDLTAEAFDAEGFYRTGDAVRLVDPNDPARGIEFDGRIAEDFKLSSGTAVRVGALRVRAVAALAPVAQDVVVAGADRDAVALLVFPSESGCRALCPEAEAGTALATLLADGRVREQVATGMRRLACDGGGSSTHATRALLMNEPALSDANEITDKGYVNQHAVLARRAALVEDLYRTPVPAAVIEIGGD